jgi:RimJ/RimL family protein N-acetyltransferase
VFSVEYQPLLGTHPDWAKIACLPWDEAIFGFPVADLRLSGDPFPETNPSVVLREALDAFCGQTKSELVSARADGADTATQAMLIAAGFLPVDFSILAQIQPLKPESLPKHRFPMRPAEPEDHEAILRIAESAFAFGRYHGDPRFPRDLANRRYMQWVRNALDSGNPDDHVLVLGRPNAALGFMNVVIRDGNADLRLGAVDPENEIGFAGFALYAETLRAVHTLSARSASAKISAANTRAMNVCASLGFRFFSPEATLHWHAPNSSRLLPMPLSLQRGFSRDTFTTRMHGPDLRGLQTTPPAWATRARGQRRNPPVRGQRSARFLGSCLLTRGSRAADQ